MRDVEREIREAEEKSLMYKRLIWIIGFAPAFAIAIAGKYLVNVIGLWCFLLIASSMLVFLLVLAGLAFKYHRRYMKLKKQCLKEKKSKKEPQKFDDLYVKRKKFGIHKKGI